MEGEALNPLPAAAHPRDQRDRSSPPPILEKIVLCLIPPPARESVGGDLCEMYVSPRQYARAALRAIPFVVLSQVRRQANFPVLGLQGLLIFSFFSGMGGSVAAAAANALVMLAAFALREAYRGSGRPSVEGALIAAVLVGAMAELCALTAAHMLRPDFQTMAYFGFFGPLMVPVLCLLRTAVIVWNDRSVRPVTAIASVEAVVADYRAFARRAAWQCRGEAGALVAVAFLLAALAGPAWTAVSALYLLAAIYLLLNGEAGAPENGSLVREQFRRELARQHRLRSLVCWLWSAPLFLALQARLAGQMHQPLSILEGIGLALLAGFFVESLNRERRGRVQEEIGGLANSGGIGPIQPSS